MTTTSASTGPFERLLLVVSGSLSAAFVPYWANWLRIHRSAVRTRVVVTPSALRFVTPTALGAATGGPVYLDSWQDEFPHSGVVARHTELAEWTQATLVYPASWHYLARIAQGLADTPSLLALHTSNCPVLVAPSVPPGSLDSSVFQEHLARIRARKNHAVAPMLVATSATTGQPGALVPPPLPDLVARLEAQALGMDTPETGSEPAVAL